MAGGDCSEALDRLFEYIDDELPQEEVQKIGAHLKSCPPCEAEHQIKEKIKALTSRTGGDKAPEDLRARVLASLRAVREDA
ncbi:mycothiol system anti-sigma-R factor [Demequina sp. B12]|uniref:mycothiol system anti-sigma-R factor n=1 Tax=Demequina sp. B12 TaxID=2992757 RepID=UPI00237AF9B5|nr:mycothiol system anti-sigma-R factor [Demequina sp. B12]MDE0573841.1 mycothiol system anti-sigma-R factor [Demequina sp. B12]